VCCGCHERGHAVLYTVTTVGVTKAVVDGVGGWSAEGRPTAWHTHYFLWRTFQSQFSHATRAFCGCHGQFSSVKRRCNGHGNAAIDGSVLSSVQESFMRCKTWQNAADLAAICG
jgi:hypothetical protein